jgi:hypothetical protein
MSHEDLYLGIDEAMADLRRTKPALFAKALAAALRRIARREGPRAAEEHMARLAVRLDAADRRLAARRDKRRAFRCR